MHEALVGVHEQEEQTWINQQISMCIYIYTYIYIDVYIKAPVDVCLHCRCRWVCSFLQAHTNEW